MRAGKVSNGPNQSKKNFSGHKRKPRLQSDPRWVTPIRAKLDVSHRAAQVALGSYVQLLCLEHTIQSKVRCFWPMKAAKVAIGFYVGDHTNQSKVGCFWPMAAAQVAIGFYVDHTNQSIVGCFWTMAAAQVAIGFYVDHTNQSKVGCFWPMAAEQIAIGSMQITPIRAR